MDGDHKPTGKLPYSWPRSMKQIPIHEGDKTYGPLFPYGFGLRYQTTGNQATASALRGRAVVI